MDGRDPRPLVYIVAGEPSGDLLGARLMAALDRLSGGRIVFAGLGGDAMAARGVASLFPIDELSYMGLDAVPHIPRLLRRMGEVAADARARSASVVVTIDVPDFAAGVWRRLKGRGIPLVHYVAPSVWAWRPGRARKYARYLDHLLALLPFEPPYFEREGLATTFVGHPVLEGGAAKGDGPLFRARHGLDAHPIVAFLPGSRRSEVMRHAAPFAAAQRSLAARFPDLIAVVPTVGPVAAMVRAATADWGVRTLVVEGEPDKYDAVAAADVALVASGTATLEVALADVPMIVTYRTGWLTHAVGRRLVRVSHLGLVNLLLGRGAVPELLQEDCRGDRLAAALAALIDDEDARGRQRRSLREAVALLASGDETPSERAARVILSLLEKGTRR
ncbi:MAG: lipid-A-disaccharide synthase [Alphaproteobacteria bacterium]|nr:lipid-A-disaccharide synthase [Alphaproteobacteria bacterium]